jgi:hypothetical protein
VGQSGTDVQPAISLPRFCELWGEDFLNTSRRDSSLRRSLTTAFWSPISQEILLPAWGDIYPPHRDGI